MVSKKCKKRDFSKNIKSWTSEKYAKNFFDKKSRILHLKENILTWFEFQPFEETQFYQQ